MSPPTSTKSCRRQQQIPRGAMNPTNTDQQCQNNTVVDSMGDEWKPSIATRTIAASPMVHSAQARCEKCTKRGSRAGTWKKQCRSVRETLIDRRTSYLDRRNYRRLATKSTVRATEFRSTECPNIKDNRAKSWVAFVTVNESRSGQIAPVHPLVMPPPGSRRCFE
jgi:hypothetical protein